MMTGKRSTHVPISAGFAAGTAGAGVVYAELGAEKRPASIVRVGFRCRPLPALRGRDIAYAALTALAGELRALGVRDPVIAIGETAVVDDLASHRALPGALTVPYVALRCALNRLGSARIVLATTAAVRELTTRAHAEASLGVAA